MYFYVRFYFVEIGRDVTGKNDFILFSLILCADWLIK